MPTILLITTGCVPQELVRAARDSAHGSPSLQLAVIAEVKNVVQSGETIPGVLAQVIFTDENGTVLPFDREIALELYAADSLAPRSVKPSQRWRFTSEQVKQSRTTLPLGVVHQFWLPLQGKLADVKKFELLTHATTPDGATLSQWNRLANQPASMQIEESVSSPEITPDAASGKSAAAGP